MTRINRAAWQRIKARLAAYPEGTIYGGTVTSITVGGVTFSAAPPDTVKAERSATFYKSRSCGYSMMLLEQFRELFSAKTYDNQRTE